MPWHWLALWPACVDGFTHILEPVLVGGNQPFFTAAPSGCSWMVGTEKSSLMTLADDANGPRTPTGLGGG